MSRLWNDLKILDCLEIIEELPSSILCLEPHPYVSLGAPYGRNCDPWRLRVGVIHRLLDADRALQLNNPSLRLAIFDAWRPIQVQAFMVDHEIEKECSSRGLSRRQVRDIEAVKLVIDEVERFWAQPSLDPSSPPPHCTGGAVDLTLANSEGLLIDMGGEIDQISSVSEPNHYKAVKYSPDSKEFVFHKRRNILSNVMLNAGFVQHPNEWWHYSYGDQLWAWITKSSHAIYGNYEILDINSRTF